MDIVGRAAWGFRQTRSPGSAPVSRQGLVLHHTVTPEWRGPNAFLRLNELMIRMGFVCVGYTILITVDGLVGAGRPLNQVGGHTRGFNTTRHAIGLIGNFDNKRPPPAMEQAIIDVYQHGQSRGWWPARFTGHRDHGSTACPGGAAYRRLPSYRSGQATVVEKEWSDMATEAEIRSMIDERIARSFDLGNASDGRYVTETHREVTRLLEAAELGRLRDLQYVVETHRKLREAGLTEQAEQVVALLKGGKGDGDDDEAKAEVEEDH